MLAELTEDQPRHVLCADCWNVITHRARAVRLQTVEGDPPRCCRCLPQVRAPRYWRGDHRTLRCDPQTHVPP